MSDLLEELDDFSVSPPLEVTGVLGTTIAPVSDKKKSSSTTTVEQTQMAKMKMERDLEREKERKERESKDKLISDQSKEMDIILLQNALLEKELKRLMGELDTATQGIQKKGFLSKWQEKEISMASKWTRRYFVLQRNQLSYYADDKSHQPRRTISLRGCTVKNEGPKKNGNYIYSIFSIFLSGAHEDDPDTLLLRLSCDEVGESALWIDMLERACSIDSNEDDGKSPPTTGNWNFDKDSAGDKADPIDSSSIARGNNNNVDDALTCVDPQLVVQVGLPATDADAVTSIINSSDLSPKALERITSVNSLLKQSLTRASSSNKLNKTVSNNSNNNDNENDNSNSKKLLSVNVNRKNNASEEDPASATPKSSRSSNLGAKKDRSFPASKSIHIGSQYSPLSSEMKPGSVNYRGFFNLMSICLLLTHFHLIVENIFSFIDGIVPLFQADFVDSSSCNNDEKPTFLSRLIDSQMCRAFLSWFVSLSASLIIEKAAASSTLNLNEKVVVFATSLLCIVNIVIPCSYIWFGTSSPVFSIVYLFQSCVIWMKLISYAHVNHDLRCRRRQAKIDDMKASKEGDLGSPNNSMTNNNNASNNNRIDSNAKAMMTENIHREMSDLEPPYLSYPMNLSYSNILYFAVVPTLCYQLNYPRYPRVRVRYILSYLGRILGAIGMIIFIIEQYIKPTLANSIIPIQDLDGLAIFQRILKLSIPNTYVWLLGFYLYFHCWLNLLAEVTRFGDRMFYKEWWNAKNIETYWRLWNLPVHNWMLRHLYYPILRWGYSRNVAVYSVFLFSAMFHEVVISVPFRYFALHAFFGMLAQAPLTSVTKWLDKRFENPLMGNVLFWCVFCVFGQPIGVIMYYFDIQKNSNPSK